MVKLITAYGSPAVMFCDGRCDKAWGINNRPCHHFSDDVDDYVFLGDSELGVAPAEPGTWEGDDTKPSPVPTDNHELMNKWCFRECERCVWTEVPGLPDMERPVPNMPGRK